MPASDQVPAVSVAVSPDPVVALDAWLTTQAALPHRQDEFDLDDEPDAAALGKFPRLHEAVTWLNHEIKDRWHAADAAALRSQNHHHWLARVSIVNGTAAILMAVAQLALKESAGWLSDFAARLEGVAVAAAVIAVVFGLVAKRDRRWFGQRHLAERFRFLKFFSLGDRELWEGDLASWRQSVRNRINALEKAGDFEEVTKWSTGGEIEPAATVPLASAPDHGFSVAMATYYRCKRVDYQAGYFRRRRDAYKHQTARWRHLSVPFFFLSVLCVIAHFSFEHLVRAQSAVTGTPAGETSHHLLEQAAIWCVAAAAMIPVFSLGLRSWFAAFELPRSTSLFAAKYQALVRASEQLRKDAPNPVAVMRHIAADEHFLENEHREWLRLLLDTEWFL